MKINEPKTPFVTEEEFMEVSEESSSHNVSE